MKPIDMGGIYFVLFFVVYLAITILVFKGLSLLVNWIF